MVELSKALDDIGLGRYQLVQSLIIGGLCMVDGAEILLSSSVLGALQQIWHLSALTKAFMMSFIFIGVFIGNLLGGTLADKYGRRTLVLGSYVGLITFGALTAAASGPTDMLIIRFFFGISYGMGIGPGVGLQVESAPAAWRGHLLNMGSVFFAVGELYTALLLLIFMPNLVDPTGHEWRHVTLLDVVPGAVILPFAFLLLRESPHYYLMKGKYDEALEVVKYIAHVNGKEDVLAALESDGGPPELAGPVAAAPGEGTALVQAGHSSMSHWQQLRMVFSRDYRSIAIGGSCLCFVANFLFYGLSYGLPQTFSAMGEEISPAMQVLIVAFCSFPGVLVSLLLIESRTIGHRDGMALLAGFATLLQLSLITIDLGPNWHWLGLPSAYLSKYVASAFFTLVYVYLGEVFPSVIRCTGLSVCIACGRFGSMSAPLLFELLSLLHNPIGPHASFLMFNAALCVLAVLVIRVCLSYEMKNAPLEDLAAPPACAAGLGALQPQRRLSLERSTPRPSLESDALPGAAAAATTSSAEPVMVAARAG